MSAVTTLRRAISTVLSEAESRAIGVIETTQEAVDAFISAIASAASAAARQVVDIVFDLASLVVTEAFNVADAVVTAALGEVQNADDIPAVDEIINEAGVYTKEAD